MMDIDGHYEMQRQKRQDRLREAEHYRLARELGFTEAGALRSIAAKLRAWLSRIISPEVTGSDDALIRQTRYGGYTHSV
jgi:hypothetical protein